MSRAGASQGTRSRALSFNTTLGNILRTRQNYVTKIKELDERIITLLCDNLPTTNEHSLQLMRTALSASSINFDNTYVEYHRPNQSQLVIAQRDKVTLNYHGRTETEYVTSSTPPPATSSVSQAQASSSINSE